MSDFQIFGVAADAQQIRGLYDAGGGWNWGDTEVMASFGGKINPPIGGGYTQPLGDEKQPSYLRIIRNHYCISWVLSTTCYFHPNLWGNAPIWNICFKWVESTN